MPLNLTELDEQINEMIQDEISSQSLNEGHLELALETLTRFAAVKDPLIEKVSRAAKFEPNLRAALPAIELLNASIPLPEGLPECYLVAADGSQITPDRHLDIYVGVLNMAAYIEYYGQGHPPTTITKTQLLHRKTLEALGESYLSMELVHRLRDLDERRFLIDTCLKLTPPVIGLMDGPAEMWEASVKSSESRYQKDLEEYRQKQAELVGSGVAVAGYIDKPAANPVVRLLEIALAPEPKLPEIASFRPLSGVSDRMLFRCILPAGYRSASFGLHALSVGKPIFPTLFFYINVGDGDDPHIARVEAPEWIFKDPTTVERLHSVVYDQCRQVEGNPYPYGLGRSHEEAVLTGQDRDFLVRLIAERREEANLPPTEGLSAKQINKKLS